MEHTNATVTVAIPAHEEQETIRDLLNQILRQETTGFSLREIIVLSDYSTDDTVAQAKQVADPRIKVIETPERMGQNRCQNTLFRMAEGDIVVFLEADMIPQSPHYLKELIDPILRGDVVSTYGATEPWLNTKGFGSLLYFIESAKVLAFRSHRRGKNIFTCHSGKAVLKSRATNLNWPPDIAEDAYFYLFGRYTLRSVQYTPRAVLYYHVPTSLFDYFRESMRFVTSKRTLKMYFSPRTIRREYSLSGPIALDFIGMLSRRPLVLVIYLIMVSIARFLSIFIAAHTPTWKTAHSTKMKYQGI